MEDLSRSLRQHPFVEPMTDAQVQFLSGCTKNVRFSPGQYLFQENDPANQLFLLRSGKVALETHVPGQGAVQVETLGAGDVIGWRTLLAPHAWHVDCRALEPTLAFSIDGICLREKLAQDSELAVMVLRGLLLVVHQRLERARLQQLDIYKRELK